EQAKADEKNAELKEKRADAENTKKVVKNIQSKVEKTTLGDLGVLADLKKKMDNESTEAKPATNIKTEVSAPEETKETAPVTAKATTPSEAEEVAPAETKADAPDANEVIAKKAAARKKKEEATDNKSDAAEKAEGTL